jgi:fructokinase
MERVICFGEIVWDLLPHGRFLGGAPLNVAYHLARLGARPVLASAVGRDALGDAALTAIEEAGVDGRAVARHAVWPTGTAEVQLDAGGQARFRLPRLVAWDEISVEALVGGPPPAAIVFGTLALRGPGNRAALGRLLDAFPRAWVVCDLNLRPPFDELAPLEPLLRRAALLKLNADEARRLAGVGPEADRWVEISARLGGLYPGAAVCITLGGDGAGLRAGPKWHQVTTVPVEVRDTVGAGDAFTAALVAGRLRAGGAPNWARHLRSACALGGFVASRDGAQPDYAGFKAVL